MLGNIILITVRYKCSEYVVIHFFRIYGIIIPWMECLVERWYQILFLSQLCLTVSVQYISSIRKGNCWAFLQFSGRKLLPLWFGEWSYLRDCDLYINAFDQIAFTLRTIFIPLATHRSWFEHSCWSAPQVLLQSLIQRESKIRILCSLFRRVLE